MATTATTGDIEAQNDRYESELERVKSAGAITISPELFERVISCRIVLILVVLSAQDDCSGGFPPAFRQSDAFGIYGVVSDVI